MRNVFRHNSIQPPHGSQFQPIALLSEPCSGSHTDMNMLSSSTVNFQYVSSRSLFDMTTQCFCFAIKQTHLAARIVHTTLVLLEQDTAAALAFLCSTRGEPPDPLLCYLCISVVTAEPSNPIETLFPHGGTG